MTLAKFKKLTKKKLFIGAAVAAAIIVTAVTLSTHSGNAVAATTVTKEASATVGDLSTTISGTGTLAADDSVSITVPAGIKIKKVLISSGDTVKKGTKIASVYKSSVAEILLSVNENIEELEDAIEDLDDYSDTDSDEYLQYLIYQASLEEAQELQAELKTMLKTGYIKAGAKGTVVTVNLTDDTEVSSSSGTQSSGSASGGVSNMSADTTADSGTQSGGVVSLSNAALTDTKVLPVSDEEGETEENNDTETTDDASKNASAETSDEQKSQNGEETADNTEQKETKEESETNDKVLTEAELSTLRLDKPEAGRNMQTSIDDTDAYTGSIAWKADGKTAAGSFQEGTTYTAEITLNAKDGYAFSTENDAYSKISLGNATLVKVSSDGKKMTIQATYVLESSQQTETSRTGTENETESQTSKTAQSGGSTSQSSGFNTSAASGGSSSSASGGSSSSSSSSASDESISLSSVDSVSAVTLSTDNTMVVNVTVDEADINSVSEGQNAEVTVSAVSEEAVEGTITAINTSSSSSDSGSVKYSVDVTIDKTEGMLEGMTASCVIKIEEAENAVMIPSAAIQESKGSAFVYTQQESDGTLSGKTEITTGLSNGSFVQITEGLSEGDTVYYTVSESDSSDSNEKSGLESGFGGMGGMDGNGGHENRNGGNMGGGTPPSGGPGGQN